MKIATYNANSIRTRLPMLLDWLEAQQPDLLGIQETKVQDADFPREALEALGYHLLFCGEKSYNGVALLSKEAPDEFAFGFEDGGPKDDTRLIYARYGSLRVFNTYIPQGRAIDHIMYRYKLGWYARLKRWIEQHASPDDPVVWLGDMNIAVEPIDVTQPQSKKNDPCYHEEARNAFLEVCDFGFTDLLRKHHPDEALFSFFDYRVADAVERNLGWRIDYVLTTPCLSERSIDCTVDLAPRRLEKPSDHTFVVATFAEEEA